MKESIFHWLSAQACSPWDEFVQLTLEICDFTLSFGYIDHRALLGFLKSKTKIRERSLKVTLAESSPSKNGSVQEVKDWVAHLGYFNYF